MLSASTSSRALRVVALEAAIDGHLAGTPWARVAHPSLFHVHAIHRSSARSICRPDRQRVELGYVREVVVGCE